MKTKREERRQEEGEAVDLRSVERELKFGTGGERNLFKRERVSVESEEREAERGWKKKEAKSDGRSDERR